MRIRKIISGISALAVAASAFAGLAVNVSAENTVIIQTITYDEDGAAAKFTPGNRFATGIQDSPEGGVNTTKCEFMTGSGSSNGYGYYTPLTDAQAAGKTLVFEFDTYFNDRVCNLSLSAGGSRAATTEGRALTFSYNANDGKVKIGNSETFGNVTTVGNAKTWLHIVATVNNTSKSTDLKVYNMTASGDYSSAAPNYTASVPFSDATLAAVKGFDFFAPNMVGLYIDNISISEYVPSTQIEAVSSVSITGADSMTFGADPDTAASNQYQVVITGENGTTLDESNISPLVSDFNVKWDIEGFKTTNDTDGQYCDSYGAFATNNAAQVGTSFELRNVPMNFYGKMTATVTYNGGTYVAEKYVTALGHKATASGQILPEAGYPSDFDVYPDSLVGYNVLLNTYAASTDNLVGGWAMAGSDPGSAVITKEGTNKFVRVTAAQLKKSHVLTNPISSPATQVIFEQDVRFNSTGGVITLTSGYPFWSSSKYTNPVTLSYDGSTLKLNNTAITKNDASVGISSGTWYKIVLSADKTNETCYVKVYDSNGSFVGGTDNIAWLETSNPTYYSVGMGNSNIGSIDFDNYSAYYPTADTSTYALAASQDTLSIPNGDTADLSASLKTAEGYDITGTASWTVLEDDMKAGVIVTPDAKDSHTARVTLASGAEAGTATVQVNIGGYTKTVELNITSSAESIKFTKSSTSVSIPLNDTPITAEYSAAVVDGSENEVSGRTVEFAVYDKNNTSVYTLPAGISFANGVLTVTKDAPAVTFTIRATGKNSDNEDISKSVKVTVHGLSFDFGAGDDTALADGYTAVSTDTSYTAARGYGIASGAPSAGGTASTENAASDYLAGAMTFKADVEKGKNYTVDITYQGTLTTGYVNSDLAGYTLGTQDSLAQASYIVPVPVNTLDLEVSGDGAKIAAITITKNADKAANAKPDIHHVGDSTAANNGSWAYYIDHNRSSFPTLDELATFCNNGAGGRNLSTYYTEGKLASVLRSIEPGDIVMFGNNGTNGMGSSFEADVNYYLDAAETMGAKIIINSYTPHGAVYSYASCYNSTNHTFNGWRQDSYDVIVRKVAEERAASDPNYLGFVEIGKNADAAFNAYVADYAANGYASADAAAQAIIACFSDHNHYSENSVARELMLNGYGGVKGIIAQLTELLKAAAPKSFDELIKEDTEGAKVNINTSIDGGGSSAVVPANAEITIASTAEIKNGTITSASGTFTLTKGKSVITNVSTVQFDGNGKITPGDGAIIKTKYTNTNNETVSDNGYFITRGAGQNTIKITIDETPYRFNIGETINGDVLIGVFVTGIPQDKTVTVTAE